MDLKIKLLKFPNGLNYLVVLAQGIIDRKALERVFGEVKRTSRALSSCAVFIDLEEAILKVQPSGIHAVAKQFGPDLKLNIIKVAVVSSEFDHCRRLHVLREALCRQGLRVALFGDTKTAAAWLSDPI